MAKKVKLKLKSGDFLLTVLVMGLVVFGIIMVFSASYYTALSDYGNPYKYLIRDVCWAIAGTIAFIFCAFFDYRHYKKFAYPLIVVGFVLLLLTFTKLGSGSHGATRWLKLGPITMMPGELAKAFVILFVARFLSDKPKRIKSFTQGILPVVCVMGGYVGLILLQPNMSTAITVAGIMCGMMFVAGLDWKWVGSLLLLGGGGGYVLLHIPGAAYRLERYTSFLDPFADPLDTGWQVVQSLLAMGSGGLTGLGLGKSIQKTLYLPEPQNDFIFAIIGEELGFIGCMILIGVYLLLIWRCCHVCLNAPDLFGMLIASGITIMLAAQVMLNIAVVTSCMPPTGIILPFISYGGNALLIFMAAMGILINISRHAAV